MGISQLINNVREDLARSLPGFAPEIVLVATIVLLLLVPIFLRRSSRVHFGRLALCGLLVALICSVAQLTSFVVPAGSGSLLVRLTRTQPDSAVEQPVDLFRGGGEARIPADEQPRGRDVAGLIRFDSFTCFFRLFLIGFAALLVWLTMVTGLPEPEDTAEFYTLLLGATLGMTLMVSSVHLLMLFIAVEMASLPSYALAGFLKERRDASEASLKYVVFGAGASGIMLYGMSLLAGRFGTAHIPSLGIAIAQSGTIDGAVLLGLLFILVGIAFKLSAVPFHFWCPDVFEGASAEVAGFLSVASKAAALGLLARFTMALCCNTALVGIADRPELAILLAAVISLLAAVTATYGNLAAYAQTNLKRLLAFSTIAHAGYMLMPLAAALVLGVRGLQLAAEALDAMVFYLIIYLFMNLGAFAVVAFIRNMTGSEDLSAYTGFIRRSPVLTVAMAVFLLSLTGIPPLAGFAAKFRIFYALYQADLIWLLAVGLINTLFSLFYYVKVLRVMIIDQPEPAAVPAVHKPVPDGAAVYCSLFVVVNLAVMLVWGAWDAVADLSSMAVPHLLGTM